MPGPDFLPTQGDDPEWKARWECQPGQSTTPGWQEYGYLDFCDVNRALGKPGAAASGPLDIPTKNPFQCWTESGFTCVPGSPTTMPASGTGLGTSSSSGSTSTGATSASTTSATTSTSSSASGTASTSSPSRSSLASSGANVLPLSGPARTNSLPSTSRIGTKGTSAKSKSTATAPPNRTKPKPTKRKKSPPTRNRHRRSGLAAILPPGIARFFPGL